MLMQRKKEQARRKELQWRDKDAMEKERETGGER